MAFDLPAFTLTPAMCAPALVMRRDAMPNLGLEMQSLANNGVSTVLILIRHRFPAVVSPFSVAPHLHFSNPDRSR
jgi:hypothetical protein